MRGRSGCAEAANKARGVLATFRIRVALTYDANFVSRPGAVTRKNSNTRRKKQNENRATRASNRMEDFPFVFPFDYQA